MSDRLAASPSRRTRSTTLARDVGFWVLVVSAAACYRLLFGP